VKMLEHITVGLTMTDSDAHLLSYAAMLVSMGIGRKLEFVHVAVPGHASEPGSNPATMRQKMQLQVTQHLGDAVHRIETDFHVREGVRVDALLEFLEQTDSEVILVGHRRNRSGKRSLARRLAMISPASVWMVPDQVPCRVSKVLAPIDFSSHSADSLSIATGVVRVAGLSECLALNVYFDASTVRYDEQADQIRGNEQREYEQFIRPVNTHDIVVTPVFEEASNVSRAILRVAEEQGCDLIVMSTRGRSAAASILLGSETSQTMMESGIPVLAVKHRGARMNLFQVLKNPEFWARSGPKTN
jgi:sulfate permease, SulP family